jgi:hypothetical protein
MAWFFRDEGQKLPVSFEFGDLFPGYIFDNIICIYNIGLIINCGSPFAYLI